MELDINKMTEYNTHRLIARNHEKVIGLFRKDDANFSFFNEMFKRFMGYNGYKDASAYVEFEKDPERDSYTLTFHSCDKDKILSKAVHKYGAIVEKAVTELEIKCIKNKIDISIKFDPEYGDSVMAMLSEKLESFIKMDIRLVVDQWKYATMEYYKRFTLSQESVLRFYNTFLKTLNQEAYADFRTLPSKK